MPGLHDKINANITATINQNLEEHKSHSQKKQETAPKIVEHNADGYSNRSSVARAYRSGDIPFDHARLLRGVKKALAGQEEGEFILQEVLTSLGLTRKSALNMFGHMKAFGVLKHYEPRHRCVFVSISSDWFERI